MLPTLRGVLILLLAAPIMALGTWLPALEWVSWIYILAVGLLLALDWRLAGKITRFEINRQHDSRLSLGADNPIRIAVHNRHHLPAKIWLRDEPPEAFQIEKHILSGEVAGRGIWHELYHVHPLRRGDYAFGDLNLRWNGPLGLVVCQGRLPASTPVKVYPNLLDVRRYDLLLQRNRLQEMGLRHSRMFGEGTDFERLREYLPDDDFRHIDWKATARRNRPVTTEYQTERSQNIVAVLDTGRMMQSPVTHMAKLDYTINAVLLLAYVATGKGDRVGMMTFSDQVNHFISPRQGRGQFYRMLELLYAVEPQPVEPDYRRALSYLALTQRKRALVIIFTDLSGGLSLNTLVSQTAQLARNHLPLVVTISDPDVLTATQQRPQNTLAVYQRAAASQLLEERRVMLEKMRRQGVMTLDVPANQLTITVINRYLELKGKTLL